MTRKINTEGLLPIQLTRNSDGSVSGSTGQHSVTWPADYASKPTRRNRRVMLNCYWYKPVWSQP